MILFQDNFDMLMFPINLEQRDQHQFERIQSFNTLQWFFDDQRQKVMTLIL